MGKDKAPTVFLDRDGTINEDIGYLSDPAGLVLIAGAGEAIRLLNDKGARVVVVTNQSGVGRGYYTHSDVEAVNKRLEEMLALEGARLDAVYYCPHRPDEGCSCRKPLAGMAEAAAAELGVDHARAYVVGDKASDVELARKIKAKGVLVLTGKGAKELEGMTRDMTEAPDFVAKDLLEAVSWILADMERAVR